VTLPTDELRDAAASAGLHDVRPVRGDRPWGRKGLSLAIEATMRVAGVDVPIGIGLPSGFPGDLPHVVVRSGPARVLPHVERNGKVCVIEDENTFHDHRRAEDVLAETISRARNVIEDGLLGTNASDFLDEAEAYWEAPDEVPCLVAADGPPRMLAALYGAGAPAPLLAVVDSAAEFARIRPDIRGRELQAVYLPLDPARVKPEHPRRFESWAFLDELGDHALALLRAVRVSKRHSLLVVIGIPRQKRGGVALVGLQLRKFDRAGTVDEVRPRSVRPIKLERFDGHIVHERRGTTHTATRLMLIGCGAVGGHVADAVARRTTELGLVDDDVYSVGNASRHVVGAKGWTADSKVDALRRHLTETAPWISLTAIKATGDTALAEHTDMFRGASAVIIAIGNPTVPLLLNDTFAEQRFPVPVIFTWLEPYGIGGHAVLVRYGKPGCLRCLFGDSPEDGCRVDFAAPGQRFARGELGCHGLYTPYADLDARETALLAARLVDRAVSNPAIPSWIRSWRGDAAAFVATGHELSTRYESHPQGTDERVEPLATCVACGK
jgi:molybdopterin/thiamine biosynthesis adenylyltransferase